MTKGTLIRQDSAALAIAFVRKNIKGKLFYKLE